MDPESIYELPGKFYLGKEYELSERKLTDDYMVYDSKDLVTHALCVGMTGSGKTGLCLSLLEEAAIDKIPIICVDPKGDLGNLLLTFPDLKGSDFAPWVDPSEATQKEKTAAELGDAYAEIWQKGLSAWNQRKERIAKFRDSTDITIYTPGSNIGVPLTVLKSFDAPGQEVIDDGDTFREKITSAVSGLLTLLSVEGDPLTSREHILLSKILETAWRDHKDVSLVDLIRMIQVPPIDRIGVIDVESFFPASQRATFAMTLNNLLASPAFAGWLEGEPMNIQNLLYTQEGKPRISIISIAHLSDTERMFFVTILLGELLGWMRTQPGTGALRALFYMDEVYGYFPPSAKPPSKPPMLTLLKQARAFGLGIMLATQNPVDLDYKGLSNIGTWFLGRLQTDRDKQRVLDGLEGASAQSGAAFDRAAMEQTLAALGARVFLMNNVHKEKHIIFQTRWALSFLRGPLSRQHISELMRSKRDSLRRHQINAPTLAKSEQDLTANSQRKEAGGMLQSSRPVIPGDITELFWLQSKFAPRDASLVYRPNLMSRASVHFVKPSNGIDEWQDIVVVAPIDDKVPQDVWRDSAILKPNMLQESKQPDDAFTFAELPIELVASRNYKTWQKDLQDWIFRSHKATIYYAPVLDRASRVGQSESDARAEFANASRDLREKKLQALQDSYRDKADSLKSKLDDAFAKLTKEEQEAQGHFWDSAVQIGTSVLGALIGRKKITQTNITRVSTAARKMTQSNTAKADLIRAQQRVEELQSELDEIQRQCDRDIESLKREFEPESLTVETIEIPCRKGDMQVDPVAILWVPYAVDSSRKSQILVDMPEQDRSKNFSA